MDILSKYISKSDIILKTVLEYFTSKNIDVCVGAELEFYCEDLSIDALQNKTNLQIIPEKGEGQFELITPHFRNPEQIISYLNHAKNELQEKLTSTNFLAKPYPQKPASGLHFHINLEQNGRNLFEKLEGSDPEILLNSIGGILYNLLETMIIYAPSEECFRRYQDGLDTPTTISWGGNNRSCAIRIPAPESGNRRIEVRIISPLANPALALSAILWSIKFGIQNKTTPPVKIFGNAFDKQYNLPRFPMYSDAKILFEKSAIKKEFDQVLS